jgi:hypothetical protein
MGNQISWHVVLAIKQDQLDDFQALTREIWSSREPNRARKSKPVAQITGHRCRP